MLPRKIASRYAEALFDIALQKNTVEAWEQELTGIAQVFADSPEFIALLTHPEIPLARKEDTLKKTFASQISQEVMAVLLLLIKRGHDPDMSTLRDIFHERWNEVRRVMPVSVTTAVPLSEPQTQALTQALAKRTGASIRLQLAVDPRILAGMVVTIGDRVIDASARTTLEQLRASMAGA